MLGSYGICCRCWDRLCEQDQKALIIYRCVHEGHYHGGHKPVSIDGQKRIKCQRCKEMILLSEAKAQVALWQEHMQAECNTLIRDFTFNIPSAWPTVFNRS